VAILNSALHLLALLFALTSNLEILLVSIVSMHFGLEHISRSDMLELLNLSYILRSNLSVSLHTVKLQYYSIFCPNCCYFFIFPTRIALKLSLCHALHFALEL
jgi:hypothetical protein